MSSFILKQKNKVLHVDADTSFALAFVRNIIFT